MTLNILYQPTIKKFVKFLILNGKKDKAEDIIKKTILNIVLKTNQNAIKVIDQALINVQPDVEIKSIKISGRRQQVPKVLSTSRKQSLAVRSLITVARKRNEKTMADRLTAELLDSYKNQGQTLKKRDELHRLAESLRVFSSYSI